MVNKQYVNDLFERVVAETDAPTQVRMPVDGTNVSFSNTGRRSDGWFVLTLPQISQTLQDLFANNDAITATVGNTAEYEEAVWREFFGKYLSDEVARTMGKVQSLPLFELLSKIVHFASSAEIRTPKTLDLTPDALKAAKEAVTGWHLSSVQKTNNNTTTPIVTGGENVIFYGAPGTGKSYTVNINIKAANKVPIRTVFHPDLQNSDFFGCLKPKMDGDNVRYEFSKGPFMKALEEAYKTPSEPVYLVIEELNRAAAAAVFGDLFLLLDRDDDGESEYGVSFPSTESQDWFNSATDLDLSELRVPPNLFIYATMNSADQGVYPIDTAFRRRWRQVYLPLKYDSGTDGLVSYIDAEKKRHELTWLKFVELLNEHLTSSQTLDVAEDRLLGQWFVKNKELDGNDIPEKVLLYLWDDLLRHGDRAHVFHSGADGTVKTYGDLVIEKQAARRFLSNSFLQRLNEAANGKSAQDNDTSSDAR